MFALVNKAALPLRCIGTTYYVTVKYGVIMISTLCDFNTIYLSIFEPHAVSTTL